MSAEHESPVITPEKPPSAPPAVTPPAAEKPKSKATGWIVVLICACLLAGGVYYYTRGKPSAQSAAKGGAGAPTGGPAGAAGGGRAGRGGGVTPVAVAKVLKGDMGVYIEAIGTVTPVYTVSVTSRVTGQLLSVNYREGQIVHKGDLLAVVDPRPYEAAVLQAQGQLQRDQASLRNANIDLQRYKAALDQHAIPEQTFATQTALVAQDEGIVKLDQGNLDAAQVNVDYTKLVSPIDGRIGLRAVDPGNIVAANGTTTLLTIAQLQPITVIFPMAQDFLSQVAPQLRAGHQLKVEAWDRAKLEKLADGTVLTLDNLIDTTTGTVKVRASFPNRDYKLFPNQFVNARLLVDTLKGVNLIPTAAIQRDNDRAYVYVLQPNKTVQSHNITVTHTEGSAASVNGVAPGDTLITDGFDRLTDGATVNVRQAVEGSADLKSGSARTGSHGKGTQGPKGNQTKSAQ